MFADKHKVIGILGGMGPRATMDLYQEILRLSVIDHEQDHIATLIYSNPKIPDRSANRLGEGRKQLLSYLIETAQVLERGGADVIVMPCNGAHCWYQQIAAAVNVPVLNMIELVAQSMGRAQCFKALLLGTDATLDSGLYQQALANKTIDVVLPTKAEQAMVVEAIYALKLDKLNHHLVSMVTQIINHYQLPVILGCTELPLMIGAAELSANAFEPQNKLINPTTILAQSAVHFVQQHSTLQQWA
jgi:aspartate racemase